MSTFEVTDFEKVCRICMKFNKTFLSITSFKIIDMITVCASVQIWENDDLPNQICNNCFLQLQNTINFKQLCENSDNSFRQIIKQNKINLSHSQNNFSNVKDEEFEDYDDDNSLINIKEEFISENSTNKNTLENLKIKIDHDDDNSKTPKTNDKLEIKNKCRPELDLLQLLNKSHKESDIHDNIASDNNDFIESFSCEKCNKEFKKVWILSKHMHSSHRAKVLKCNQCKIKCYHPLHLKKHQDLAHNPLNLTCNTCDKVFSNIYKLKDHKCKHSILKLHCERCNKSFHDQHELKCHNKEVHAGIESFVACHICGKSVSKKNLKIHMVIHEERKKLTCDLCSKSFLRQQSLNNHIKQVHENQIPARNHLCNICGHASLSAAYLHKHLRTHSTERPYACDSCDKTYRSALNLKEHISHVHLNQRKFKCTFCSQAFHEKRHLMHHERRHTGEKPHKCEVCGKRFIQKIALKIHTKTHTNSSELISRISKKNYTE